MIELISKVLEYLRNGGDANISTISRKLDINEGTVEMLLDRLVKLGYLEIVNSEINSITDCTPLKCKGCKSTSNCKPLLKVKYKIVK